MTRAANPDTSGPKTAAQCRRIWAQAREQGLDGDTLRDLVYGVTGLASIAALTKDQAAAVIEALNVDAGRIPPHPPACGGSRGGRGRSYAGTGVEPLITGEQRRKIDALKGALTWRRRDGFTRFCRKIIKADQPRTIREGQMVIEALKGWAARVKALPSVPPQAGGG